MTTRKTVAERWWDLYEDDVGCNEIFNALHLICPLYGDDIDDSDDVMQSMAHNDNYQLECLTGSTCESRFKETLNSCMWNDQYPNGYFAHLQSRLPKKPVIGKDGQKKFLYDRKQVSILGETRLQTWGEWGVDMIKYDDYVGEESKRPFSRRGEGIWGGRLFTYCQRSELETRMNQFRGVEKVDGFVLHDKE